MDAHVIEKDAGYAAIIKEMDADLKRTDREREVEAAFEQGGSIESILRQLISENDGNRAAVLRSINQRLRSTFGEDAPELSRNTLYNWMSKYDLE